jgi:hypothetical protein
MFVVLLKLTWESCIVKVYCNTYNRYVLSVGSAGILLYGSEFTSLDNAITAFNNCPGYERWIRFDYSNSKWEDTCSSQIPTPWCPTGYTAKMFNEYITYLVIWICLPTSAPILTPTPCPIQTPCYDHKKPHVINVIGVLLELFDS